MSNAGPAEIAAFTATALAVVGAVPQLRRLGRTGDASGVSLANATLGVASELGWLAYTTHGALWSAVPEALLMALTNLLLVKALVRNGVALRRPLAISMLWGAALVVGTATAGWPMLGTLLPLAYAVQVAPSIWSAYRTWAPTGIATSTWGLILLESMLWGVYGLGTGDPALTTFAAIGAVSSTAIIARVLLTRNRSSRASDSRSGRSSPTERVARA